jgi:hypothetical protein
VRAGQTSRRLLREQAALELQFFARSQGPCGSRSTRPRQEVDIKSPLVDGIQELLQVS